MPIVRILFYEKNEANNSYHIYSYSTIHNQEVNRPGYDIIRNDRKINGRKGGGVCISMQCNLNFMPDANENNTSKLKDIFSTFGAEQLVMQFMRY